MRRGQTRAAIMGKMTSSWKDVARTSDLPPGSRKLLTVEGQRLALFNVEGQLYAIENRCPHRGGPIGAGGLCGTMLTCPWHGQQFDVSAGGSASTSDAGLRTYRVCVEGDVVLVDLAQPIGEPDQLKGIHCYLVRYGVPGFVGRFGTIHRIDCQRGDYVVVQSDRGLEIGEVLALPTEQQPAVGKGRPAGELLRLMTPDDWQHQQLPTPSITEILEDARVLLARRRTGVTALDAELLLDRETVIIYFVGTPSLRLGRASVELAKKWKERRIQFQPLEGTKSAAASEETTSGKDEIVKGPHERLKYDLRRLWECPICHHRERSNGATTYMLCKCQLREVPQKRIYMKMIEDGSRRTDSIQGARRRSSLPELKLD